MTGKEPRIMKRVFFFVLLLFVPLLAIGCGSYMPMHEWGNGYMMNYGFGYGGVFMWLIFLIVLGVAIYFIVQALKGKNVIGGTQDTPLDILKRRYAKGEVTKEEFDRMKKDLQ
jgi:putative membrane protein